MDIHEQFPSAAEHDGKLTLPKKLNRKMLEMMEENKGRHGPNDEFFVVYNTEERIVLGTTWGGEGTGDKISNIIYSDRASESD